MGQNKNQLSQIAVYLLMLCLMICGIAATIVAKLQDEIVALGAKYSHAFLQSAMMFIGEFCCLGIYAIKVYQNRKRKERLKSYDVVPENATEEEEDDGLKPILIYYGF